MAKELPAAMGGQNGKKRLFIIHHIFYVLFCFWFFCGLSVCVVRVGKEGLLRRWLARGGRKGVIVKGGEKGVIVISSIAEW